MKKNELYKWIDETLVKGTFETREDAMEVMACLGVMFAQHFKVTSAVFQPHVLPLTMSKLTEIDNRKDMNKVEFDKAVNRIVPGDFFKITE